MTFTVDMLPVDAFIMFAVFARVGALFMTAPALGDFTLSPRIRLAAALAVTAAIASPTAPLFPDWARGADPGAMAGLILGEAVFGVFLGLSARLVMAALNVAGQIIAFQIGLSLAQIFDPTQELQGAIVGGFLAVLGTTMIFATDLHHLLLAALADSYVMFAPGSIPDFGDMSAAMTETLSASFSLGLRLAAPFVLFGLVFYIGAGVLNRLMPQAQVFFMLMPANLMLGVMLLMLTTGMIMTLFLGRFEAFLVQFLR
ncbi:MAG: flagellar biosynthetic protein FliR [Pseudomonadota bacterium]